MKQLFTLLLLGGFTSAMAQTPGASTIAELGTGATDLATCANDGDDDIVMFEETTTSTADYAFVVTDDMGNILAIPPANMANFEPAGAGLCHVYGVSYDGTLASGMSVMGMDINTAALSTGTFVLSSNFISVNRYDYNDIDAGTVSTVSGADTIHTCTQDGNDDIYNFMNTGTGAGQYSYIVTDDMNNILAFSAGMANFDGAAPGDCRVWGLSYNGELDSTLVGSDAASATLASGCFELSSNYIQVHRWSNDIEGGTVAEMGTGADSVGTCANDGNDDIVLFENTSTANGANYRYIVTDDNNMILAIPPANMANFEPAGAGICRVWGVSFTGELNEGLAGMDAATADLAEGCFELSSNYITISRYDVTDIDAGTITDSDTGNDTAWVASAGDGNPDIVNFSATSSTDEDVAYIITDDNGDVINVITNPMADFDGAGAGVCFVYALSYNGELYNPQGENVSSASFSSGCYEVSTDWLTIIRGTVGFADLSKTELSATVYPSPATNDIRINGLAIDETYTVEVINTLGAVVATNTNYNSNSSINVADLENGIYLVNIFSNTQRVAATRFVKK